MLVCERRGQGTFQCAGASPNLSLTASRSEIGSFCKIGSADLAFEFGGGGEILAQYKAGPLKTKT